MSKDKIPFVIFFGTLLAFVVAMNLPFGSGTAPAPIPSLERPTPRDETPAPEPEVSEAPTAPAAQAVEASPEILAADTGTTDPFLADVRRRAREDPEAALVWLQETVNGPERLQGMLEVVAIWAAADSETALLWLESNAQGLARLETLQAGIRLWGGGDPAVAASWVEGMANDGSKATAARALAASWAKRAPLEAADWIATLAPGPVRGEAASALVEAWIAGAPNEAADWALREAGRTGNPALLDEAIAAYTERDPAEAMRFIRNIPDRDAAAQAVRGYVSAGAAHTPQETAEWLADLSPNDPLYSERHPALLMGEWARTDSVAASAWLDEQPAGAFRDSAVTAFADTIIPFEPAAATAWSNAISDPQQRLAYLQKSVRAWIEVDRDAAAQWLGETELAPDLRMQLAEALDRN